MLFQSQCAPCPTALHCARPLKHQPPDAATSLGAVDAGVCTSCAKYRSPESNNSPSGHSTQLAHLYLLSLSQQDNCHRHAVPTGQDWLLALFMWVLTWRTPTFHAVCVLLPKERWPPRMATPLLPEWASCWEPLLHGSVTSLPTTHPPCVGAPPLHEPLGGRPGTGRSSARQRLARGCHGTPPGARGRTRTCASHVYAC